MKPITRRPLTNQRVGRIPASGIRRFFDMVSGIEGSISLGVGEPDFVTPERFREAAIRSVKEGRTKYTSNYGILELREAIAAHTERQLGISYDPKTEILVTVGVSEAVDLAFRATLDEGDEVILADPSYVALGQENNGFIYLMQELPWDEEHDFRLRPIDVERAITPRTRAILLGFPNNPTGGILEASDLEGIARLARKHDLLVYSDEIYDRLVYGTEHRSILSQPGMRERTVYLAGFSKSYAMTGWRVGYTCAPPEVLEQMMKIHQYTVMCVPTAAQYAALEALRTGEPEVQRMVASYDERRKLMRRRFNEIGLRTFEPRGAFYCFPNITSTGLGDDEFAARLFQEEKVVVVPGSAFGERGTGHVRACYATALDKIEEACDRIDRFVKRLH